MDRRYSGPEGLEPYEILRRQAMEPDEMGAPNPKSVAAAFIERQGLAAWVQCGAGMAVQAEAQTAAASSQNELILVLTRFIWA